MNESDSFISEVSEELRRDRLFAFLRRWGWLIAAVLLLIVGGAAANEWRKHRAEVAAQATGDALRTALQEQDPAARAEKLGALAADSAAAPLARLAEAGSLAEAGERAAAGEVLAALVVDERVPEIYRSLAGLQRVMLLGAELDASERLATLQGLTAPGAPFRPLALEQRALVYLEQGDRDAAITDLEAAVADPAATAALRERARQLIVAAGGALGLDGAAGAPPEEGVEGSLAPVDG